VHNFIFHNFTRLYIYKHFMYNNKSVEIGIILYHSKNL